MMDLRWTSQAIRVRDEIYDFIEADNPRAALALDERFSNQATRLAAFPSLGHPGRVAGTRELIVHRNYVLIYDVVANVVRVLRVLHMARQQPFADPPEANDPE